VESGGRIRIVDASGKVTTLAGSDSVGNSIGMGQEAAFSNPAGILFDKSTNSIYIADTGNHVIKKMSLLGNVSYVAGSAFGTIGFANRAGTSARFNLPTKLALDGEGCLVISDSGNNRIRRLNLTSLEVTTIAGSGEVGAQNGYADKATFNNPSSVAVSRDGSILVADKGNFKIRKISFLLE
jgi:serine/threonine protein kinase, bacterial